MCCIFIIAKCDLFNNSITDGDWRNILTAGDIPVSQRDFLTASRNTQTSVISPNALSRN